MRRRLIICENRSRVHKQSDAREQCEERKDGGFEFHNGSGVGFVQVFGSEGLSAVIEALLCVIE